MRKRGLCCRNVSVWVSVYLSHAGIVSKRLNLSENCLDHLVAHHSSLLTPCADTQLQGKPLQRGGKNWRFSTEIAVYLGNGAR